MEQQWVQRLEDICADYSELPRRVLLVLGSGQSPAVDVFEEAAKQRFTTNEPHLLTEMASGQRRSITISTPAKNASRDRARPGFRARGRLPSAGNRGWCRRNSGIR